MGKRKRDAEPSAAEQCAEALMGDDSHLPVADPWPDSAKGCVSKCMNKCHAKPKNRPRSKGPHGNWGDNAYGYILDNHKSTYTFPPKIPVDPNAIDYNIGPDNHYWTDSKPCPHEYHHMLPWIALHDELQKAQLIILQSAAYNLNSGENLIILPRRYDHARDMRLPVHCAHPEYNDNVMSVINRIVAELDPSEPHRVNEENKSQVAKQLVNWECKTFTKITEWGADQWKDFDKSGKDLPEENQPDDSPPTKRQRGEKRARFGDDNGLRIATFPTSLM